MKILITGDLGYVGPWVTRQLRARYRDAALIGMDLGYFAHCVTDACRVPEVLLSIRSITQTSGGFRRRCLPASMRWCIWPRFRTTQWATPTRM